MPEKITEITTIDGLAQLADGRLSWTGATARLEGDELDLLDDALDASIACVILYQDPSTDEISATSYTREELNEADLDFEYLSLGFDPDFPNPGPEPDDLFEESPDPSPTLISWPFLDPLPDHDDSSQEIEFENDNFLDPDDCEPASFDLLPR